MKNITVYHHKNHPTWSEIYRLRHEAKGATNGAYTYSEDIVKWHIPVIKEILENCEHENILITTVGELSQRIIPEDTDLIIYYLHEQISRELPRIKKISTFYKKRIIYITARLDVFNILSYEGYNVIHIPMAIDTSLLTRFIKVDKYKDKRVIYFGNRYLGKNGAFEEVKDEFIKNGWIFDVISNNILNNRELLTRSEVIDTISKYQYGVGEGRCVLEMNALGVKTLICASANQGIITNDLDFEIHKQHNFADGKICTFSKSIAECITNFDKAICRTVDIQDILPIIVRELKDLL